jgi:hypothetical protein
MNNHDYDTLMRHAGAPPHHALTVAHPQEHPGHPPPHTVHVVHDARHPAPVGAPPTHIVYAPPPALPPHPHAVHEAYYPPPPSHGYEHERHPGAYSPHRPHQHEHRGDRDHDEMRERRRSYPRVQHQTSAEDIRMFPIGFQMLAIAAGDVEEIEVKPQVRFQGRRLAVAPSIARYFDIVDIKVGKDSQLAATGALSGEALSALAVDVRVELDPAPPGIVITLSVRNNDAVAHDFRAVLYGLVEEVDD